MCRNNGVIIGELIWVWVTSNELHLERPSRLNYQHPNMLVFRLENRSQLSHALTRYWILSDLLFLVNLSNTLLLKTPISFDLQAFLVLVFT